MPPDPHGPAPVTDDEAVDLLQTLVGIPSPSRSEEYAADALVHWLSERGWAAHRDDVGNAVGVLGHGPREILLLGHIDTFPGTVRVRREAGHLYGRGAVDAKGPLCTFACAATGLVVPDGLRITIVGAVEEESETSRGARHILAQRPASRAPLYCVIGEPSRWDRITLGYKGSLHAHVTVRYPYSHSAGSGKLPAEIGVELWHAAEQFCAVRNRARSEREFERITPALHSIVTEDTGPFGTASLHIGFRLSLRDAPAQIGIEFHSALDHILADAPAGTALECTIRGAEPAHRSPKSTPLVRAFLKEIRAAGGEPRFVVKTGTADMNVVAPEWPETPILAYGPGDSALDHTPNEHLELDDYRRAIGVLRTVLCALTGEPGSEPPR